MNVLQFPVEKLSDLDFVFNEDARYEVLRGGIFLSESGHLFPLVYFPYSLSKDWEKYSYMLKHEGTLPSLWRKKRD